MHVNLIIYSAFAEHDAVYVYEVNTEIFVQLNYMLHIFREFNFCRGIVCITQYMMYYKLETITFAQSFTFCWFESRYIKLGLIWMRRVVTNPCLCVWIIYKIITKEYLCKYIISNTFMHELGWFCHQIRLLILLLWYKYCLFSAENSRRYRMLYIFDTLIAKVNNLKCVQQSEL